VVCALKLVWRVTLVECYGSSSLVVSWNTAIGLAWIDRRWDGAYMCRV
jgi:hypothetical protein